MTPLAAQIIKELTKPIKKRYYGRPPTLPWYGGLTFLPNLMDDIHCFEVSDVQDSMYIVRDKILEEEASWSPSKELMFLPAPKTWIEWKEPEKSNARQGWLLLKTSTDVDSEVGPEGTEVFCCINAAQTPGAPFPWVEGPYRLLWTTSGTYGWGHARIISPSFAEENTPAHLKKVLLEGKDHTGQTMPGILTAYLAMINSPKVIGRTTHMPHAGLQKKLAKARNVSGKYPLHAWTEILLKVGDPKHEDSNQEIWLTGSRALHFVRSHIRIRLGRLEVVRSHWRGDAALGIKRSRYKVVA